MESIRIAGAVLAVVTLVSCGSSGDVPVPAGTLEKGNRSQGEFHAYIDSLCDEITGGSAQFDFSADPACVDCTAESESGAIDGTDATFATINIPYGTQGAVTMRATAQEGIVFPAGSDAGIAFSAAENANYITVIVRTLLDGVEQDRGCLQSASFNERDRSVIGVETTQPFDALEATLYRNNLTIADIECGVSALSFSNPDQAIEPRHIRVHEFCHHFRIP